MGDESEKKTILLVDDDNFFQNFATGMMSEKYNVVAAKSGKEALVLLFKNKPDLILLDIIMPEMDGWETFHKIRGISLLDQVPIAFLTSMKDEKGLEHAKELGASDYFTKPLDRQDFMSRIEKILSGKK